MSETMSASKTDPLLEQGKLQAVSHSVPFEGRRAERLDLGQGAFVEAEFRRLNRGDLFRLFERDGTPVRGLHGGTLFQATDAPTCPKGVWAIDCHEMAARDVVATPDANQGSLFEAEK